MPDQQAAVHQPAVAEDETWADDAFEELPPRPRRRLLAPLPLTLLGILLIACGFIAGVLVEKGQTSSSSSSGGAGGSGLAAHFAALRGGGGGGGGAGSSAASGASAGAGNSAPGTAGGSGAGGSGASRGIATIGQVAYVEGSTLYVTTLEGNTVKVKTSAASAVTKTVSTSVKAIHPGETVVITGPSAADGKVSAEAIRVGGAGGSAGAGIGALFGGGSTVGGGGSGAGSGSARSSAGAGEPALFGKGG
ncbi:MAG TPA: hypothetical protein VGI24_06780 [Solirubrobacteraceae bacterium]|jgi:hypothetical protein